MHFRALGIETTSERETLFQIPESDYRGPVLLRIFLEKVVTSKN